MPRVKVVSIALAALGALLVQPRLAPAASPAAPPAPPFAAAPSGGESRPGETILLWSLDPLGLDPGIVGNLESLFRLELGRVNGATVLSLAEAEPRLGKGGKKKIAACEGGNECLAKIGAGAGAALVIAGNVGALGDHYIVNLKAVRTDSGAELRRIEEPLRGERETLIEAVRVAAYRILAPDKLHGTISLLTEFVGADVLLDGKPAGKTPLAAPLDGVPVGKHVLVLKTAGFPEFRSELEVRFQKTTSVLVKFTDLGPAMDAAAAARARAASGVGPAVVPWYGRWWFMAAVGAVAVGAGVTIGVLLVPRPVTVMSTGPFAPMGP